jgi:hypothetical protein
LMRSRYLLELHRPQPTSPSAAPVPGSGEGVLMYAPTPQSTQNQVRTTYPIITCSSECSPQHLPHKLALC